MKKLDNTLESFEYLSKEKQWKKQFYDDCKTNWHHHWFLDGKNTPNNTKKGMDFYAGPTLGEDADHAVLWTKDWFKGNVKIDYEYTRLDEEIRFVNILYIQATGKIEGSFTKDIAEWQDLRQVPAMSRYFNNMHTYHIAYAAFPNENKIQPGYIRARRYMASGLKGTGLKPDYEPEGFFKTGEPHRITVIKWENHIYLKVNNAKDSLLCHWHNQDYPPIIEGRIGLRHMVTRAARYSDFSIYVQK